MPGLPPPKSALTERVVTRDSRTARTAATGDWFARGECAWLREFVQVPPPTTGVDVADPLREQSTHGRQAALPVRVERSRDFETEMVGNSISGPRFDDRVENFVEPIAQSTKRVVGR
jgi:hypothetical protein